ncbi:ABC transporter ATP-binding protein [Sphaerisporangium krabiense]|uniref:Peptide/nickel transport system ATP-binding protein/oligopeptide transport system ATP-binding protein n=1 Tax=Sphaerisporangium krabiense TaxID=763782 RepID=A0A7W8Z1N2_9ACTN|nr:oligopeptide/dipeptide ABC transporter ATP-binding protein [Sphaerisporangium krabiense]MBB5625818.1 peptide/nickel transport system ATP-binding protein/oligopeptide transport system ATP-binding protein [Sphaerisporangium krabiense]GII62844.1 ABC transporter ATP-binding protein [Sphaerisporangium krabiense]
MFHSTQQDVVDPTEPVGEELLRIEGLKIHFPLGRRVRGRYAETVYAVDGVDFTLDKGQTVALVGESGCGKSTVARSLVGLVRPTAGSIRYKGMDLRTASRSQMRMLRREVQIVFQDPFASVNPRMRVRDIIEEPLRVQGIPRDKHVAEELLEMVGLQPVYANRFPHEFSGGQMQRIGIARALALKPRVLVLDEPISALDVSIQAQIINLLMDLQDELGLAYLLIAHDVAVVRAVSHRVLVMYLGRIVEAGPEVLSEPGHPYTQALLSAIPSADVSSRGRRKEIILEGDVPSPTDPPSGCRFRTRCWKAADVCAQEEPALLDRSGLGALNACHFPAYE